MGFAVGPTVRTVRKTVTFDGSSGSGQAGTVVPVYTVTGEVLLHVLTAFCSTDLTEAGATATISLGTTNQLTRFIGNTNSVDIDSGEAWVSTTPTAGSVDLPDAVQAVYLVNGDNIVVNPLTQNTNGGVLEFVALWEPLSTDGDVS